MSVDTRTPRTSPPPGSSSGGAPRGFTDDENVLTTVKVPSDPAQVNVNHASFRVELAVPAPRSDGLDAARWRTASAPESARAGAAGGAGAAEGEGSRRRAPVVWSGHTRPEDTGATRLLRAVRSAASGTGPDADTGLVGTVLRPREPESATVPTQALPRVDGPLPETHTDRHTEHPGHTRPIVIAPRDPRSTEATQPLLTGVRPVRGAYDEGAHAGPYSSPYGDAYTDAYGDPYASDPHDDRTRAGPGGAGAASPARGQRRAEAVRHAYYPGRRMNLGVVLLPLRIFLGFISIYAGMGKLCDPVYFDGGSRGSMVTWLNSLEPWAIATPLHDFALAHPVGSGLTVAFLQVIVGVLTMCGLWQRVAAGLGGLLSLALIVTVSWRTVPVYDAPDIIYLAAWSPLIIAGAPVYSMDSRLTGEAWRTLGPRVGLWDLRQRVLRRGTALATVVLGSALLLGALLGGAVRSSQTVSVPEPGKPPTNELPGSALPQDPAKRKDLDGDGSGSRSPDASRSPNPSASSSGSPSAPSDGPASPSQQQTVQAPQESAPPAAEPSAASEPTAGSTASAGSTGSSSGPGTPSGRSTAGATASGGGTSTGGSSSGGGNTGGGGGDAGGGTNGGRGALGGLLGG